MVAMATPMAGLMGRTIFLAGERARQNYLAGGRSS